MKLYLVQHGEACAKEVDAQRPLTAAGQADVERLARFLERAGIRVARVIHSGKLRAQQTAQCLAATLAPGVAMEVSDAIAPQDKPDGFDWEREDSREDALVVGHLPFMARLVSSLLVEDEDRLLTAYRPGSIVCLERVDEDHWQLDWMIRPELLAELMSSRDEL